MGCIPLRVSEPLRASEVGGAQLAAIPEELSEAPTRAIETRILGDRYARLIFTPR
jgi:hypothetical protein